MPSNPPVIYLIGGCNGVGKTTFAKAFLPVEAKCLNFLNADLIAAGIAPLNSQAAQLKAGRLLLTEFRAFVSRRETFAVESTLSGATYIRLLEHARQQGYRVCLHYLWLPTPNIAIARVRERVKKGGHNVPPKDIRRRFQRSLQHLINDYTPLADQWAVWDNQSSPPKLLAESGTCSTEALRGILRMT